MRTLMKILMNTLLLLLVFTISSNIAYAKLVAEIETAKGTIFIELFPKKAPVTVANFVNLAGRGYYNNITFHRVVPNFMIQGGDPLGTGFGGPGYSFQDEFSSLNHKIGSLSMANAGPNTNGSQFFITHIATPHLNGKHTVFGQVLYEMKVVNSIVKDDIINSIRLWGSSSAELEAVQATIDGFNLILDNKFSSLKPAEKLKNYIFPTSVSEDNYDDFKVYPNPVENKLNISIDNFKTSKLNIEILSLDGSSILKQEIISEQTQIELENLQTAAYLLIIRDKSNNLIEIKKIQKK